MPTLTEFWDGERLLYDAKVGELIAATQSLTAELKQLVSADLAGALEELSGLSDEIRRLRGELAAASVPANASALVEEIRVKVIDQRESYGRVLELKARVAEKRARLDTDQRALSRSRSDFEAAMHGLALAEQAAERRSNAAAALSAAPLNTLAADATAEKSGATATAAKARIDELPPALVAFAEQRFASHASRFELAVSSIGEAEAALFSHRETNDGKSGELWSAAQEFAGAEAALLGIVGAGGDDLNRARHLLARAESEPVVSEAEAGDAADHADGIAAATAAASVIAAESNFYAAVAAYEAAQFAARLSDPDADVTSDPTVAAAKAALENAEIDLAGQKASFPERDALRDLSVVVPDRAFSKLRDYLEAIEVLDRLAATPATLISDVTAAEGAYVTALTNAVKARRTRELIEDALFERKQRAEGLVALRSELLSSSVRGDTI
jgi:hypothetical protein